MLDAADLIFFPCQSMAFRPLIRTVKVLYQAREWTSCISGSIIRAFQSGSRSYTNWICLQYVIERQNHSYTSQLQMSLMPFPIHFNTYCLCLFQFTPHSFNTPNVILCWFSRASPIFFSGTSQASDILRSLLVNPLRLLNPLRPPGFHWSDF